MILAFSTVLPLRFVYPNHAPGRWRKLLIYGAVVWLGVVLALLPGYPAASAWWVGGTLAYPDHRNYTIGHFFPADPSPQLAIVLAVAPFQERFVGIELAGLTNTKRTGMLR